MSTHIFCRSRNCQTFVLGKGKNKGPIIGWYNRLTNFSSSWNQKREVVRFQETHKTASFFQNQDHNTVDIATNINNDTNPNSNANSNANTNNRYSPKITSIAPEKLRLEVGRLAFPSEMVPLFLGYVNFPGSTTTKTHLPSYVAPTVGVSRPCSTRVCTKRPRWPNGEGNERNLLIRLEYTGCLIVFVSVFHKLPIWVFYQRSYFQ